MLKLSLNKEDVVKTMDKVVLTQEENDLPLLVVQIIKIILKITLKHKKT